jgi:hypothetical protein
LGDASAALGAPEITGAWISSSGTARRVASTVAGAEAGRAASSIAGKVVGGGVAQKSDATPTFSGYAYVALSATELVLVKGKQGLVGMKLTGEVIARTPRGAIASMELGEGQVAAPLTITFKDGTRWDLEAARARRGAVERVIAELDR